MNGRIDEKEKIPDSGMTDAEQQSDGQSDHQSDQQEKKNKPDGESENKLLADMNKRITEMANQMERVQIADYVQLLNSPRKIIFTNIIAGISRGVGIAIGFTFFASTILYILQALGALNLPIVGDYIAEVVKYVKAQLEGRAY
ncbi:DUF5665 domain-containing protein [Paenibacillus sp. MBLB4367]|uniref:DUF5665 domain-containing protein n=1 Tax=Paenibacillus sp. MBLB4367 TaxID=3384767 RepID=UPI0039083963